MIQYLRQSTAVTVMIGPLVDATDGYTPETAIALAANELDAYKQNSATTVDLSGNTWAHVARGMYSLALTASNTDTAGLLSVIMLDTACRPFRADFIVLPTQVWDSLFAGDLLQVDVTQIAGSTSAATNQSSGADCLVTGTVVSGSSTVTVKTDLTEATNDHFNGRTVVFQTGLLAGQAAEITDYSGTTKALTVSQLTEAPAAGDTFVIA